MSTPVVLTLERASKAPREFVTTRLLAYLPPGPASDSTALGWGMRIYASIKFVGTAVAGGLRTTLSDSVVLVICSLPEGNNYVSISMTLSHPAVKKPTELIYHAFCCP